MKIPDPTDRTDQADRADQDQRFTMPNNTLLLIDGTAHLYRAFYAIRNLTDPKGRPVNVVFGFAQTLVNLLDKFKPSHAVVVFDAPGPTHRHVAFPEYKAHREKTPEDLVAQIPIVKRLLAAFEITVCEERGVEADDVLATLAWRGRQEGLRPLIFTSDKDLFQLVDDSIRILKPLKKGEYEILDADGVAQHFGVGPGQVADVLALMGDASDNIPGIPGVGEKTAVDLIRTYGSLDQVYAQLGEIGKPKLRENLASHKPQAYQAKELVRVIEAPLELAWEKCRVAPTLPTSAYEMMAELGFKRLLVSAGVSAAPAAGEWSAPLQDHASLDQVLQQAREKGELVIERIQTGLALAASGREAAFLPMTLEQFQTALREGAEWMDALCDPRVKKIGYNLKPLEVALLQSGRACQGPREDLHLIAHLVDLPANRPEDFVSRILGGPPPADRPGVIACAYWLIAHSISGKLKAVDSENVYRDIELPLLPVLAAMEAKGVAIDVAAVREMSGRLGRDMERLEAEIHDLAGCDFNLRSPQQLAEVLFQKLQLNPGKKTKTGNSTSVDVLETLAPLHPLPAKVLEYRQLQKLKSTYLDVLPNLIDPRDGRLHTTFHQVGAATGRLSSSDPNLQNIPIRSELGRDMRRMFIPDSEDDRILSADYSQIELRLLAHLSGDPRMRADFEEGLDIHSATASAIFGVPVEQVTPDMRRQAKTCNFGIAYGVTPFGLSRQLGISPARAKEFIHGFYQRYPRVREYLQGVIEGARRDGYVSTLLGRRRPVPDVHSANRNVREAGERMAINAPIQGSAADLIKLAMVRISDRLRLEGWRSHMILQVHDELLFEGPEQEMPGLKQLVVGVMSQIYPVTVALTVEAAWGRNWMEAHG